MRTKGLAVIGTFFTRYEDAKKRCEMRNRIHKRSGGDTYKTFIIIQIGDCYLVVSKRQLERAGIKHQEYEKEESKRS